jgi:hypothetical protein
MAERTSLGKGLSASMMVSLIVCQSELTPASARSVLSSPFHLANNSRFDRLSLIEVKQVL